MSDAARPASLPARADEASAVLEQVRAGLQAWRDVVLDAVIAVIVPGADAADLRAAATLLEEDGLAPERLLFFVEPRRAQLTHEFAGDDDGDDGLDLATLSMLRTGLLATRDAIRADLAQRRAALAQTLPSGAAIDAVETQRWRPQRGDRTDTGPVDERTLALEAELREVDAELARNGRQIRRRQDAEVGLRQLDNAVVGDARALARDRLQALLLDPDGADRFDRRIVPAVMRRDPSATGVLRSTRSLSATLRILDALRHELLEPVRTAWPGDDRHLAALERRCERIVLWCRAASSWRDWGHLDGEDVVWERVFATVDDAFTGPGESLERDGAFLSLVRRRRAILATGPVGARAVSTTVDAAPPSSMDGQPVADRIDRYAILRRLGGGGMGDVYLARQDGPRGFAKEVVVKTIRSTHADDPHYISLFQREARVAARLAHKHVITVFDVGVSGGRWFMAVELLKGLAADRLVELAAERAADLRLAARVVADAALGLAHAHERQVVHRDVSPDNLFITDFGVTKVIDFGVASLRDEDEGGVLMGKLPYLPPEVLAGGAPTPACDVWGLGIVLHQFLTGRRPFDGHTDFATVRRITSEHLDLAALRLESAVRGLLERMLAKDPVARPDALAVAAALEAVAASETELAEWARQHVAA